MNYELIAKELNLRLKQSFQILNKENELNFKDVEYCFTKEGLCMYSPRFGDKDFHLLENSELTLGEIICHPERIILTNFKPQDGEDFYYFSISEIKGENKEIIHEVFDSKNLIHKSIVAYGNSFQTKEDAENWGKNKIFKK